MAAMVCARRRALACVLLSLLALSRVSAAVNNERHSAKHGAARGRRSTDEWPIKHVVVLMLENRSFDHFLGFLKSVNPEIIGLTGDETNPYNTSDPSSPLVKANPFAVDIDDDFGHEVPDSTQQIFGDGSQTIDPPPMNGFVENAFSVVGDTAPSVMNCFNSSSLPVLSTLAQEFAIFDQWFASVPGPTEVNRLYVHSATSYGSTVNDVPRIVLGYPQESLFDQVTAANLSWSIYMGQISSALALSNLRTWDALENVHFLHSFVEHAAAGNLSNYTFIDPRYFPLPDLPANDQHPAHAVTEGEALIKEVYEALRNGPLWEETLMIVMYDEHGGFFDHYPTPLNGVPNPDGRNGKNPPFGFDRLGIRIPVVMASPWIAKGTVHHTPTTKPTPTSEFDHTSVIATLNKMWNFPSFLTKRDAWSGTFEDVFTQLAEPRTDCPTTLPPVASVSEEYLTREYEAPLNGLQFSLLDLAAAVANQTVPAEAVQNKYSAGRWVYQTMKTLLDEAKTRRN